jgi:hypothetical protein
MAVNNNRKIRSKTSPSKVRLNTVLVLTPEVDKWPIVEPEEDGRMEGEDVTTAESSSDCYDEDYDS